MLLPSLHTDHVTANTLRATTYNYRVLQLAPYSLIPGFIGHQTERSFPNGSLAWTDNYVRDFDLIGFPYSLLSSVASAGLNLVHAMIPARDLSEFALLPASTVQFWMRWLDWPTQHRSELDAAIPILAAPASGGPDGWVTMEPSGRYGHFFLFNPYHRQHNASLLMTDALLLRAPLPGAAGIWLLTEEYPRQRVVSAFQYGETVTLNVDGDSATVYELRYEHWPSVAPGTRVLVGVSGIATVVNASTLRVAGVEGEAGTVSGPVRVLFPSRSEAAAVNRVTVNGVSVAFTAVDNAVALAGPLSFPGLYLPRAAPVGSVPDGFTGGKWTATVQVSAALLAQLALRRATYPHRVDCGRAGGRLAGAASAAALRRHPAPARGVEPDSTAGRGGH